MDYEIDYTNWADSRQSVTVRLDSPKPSIQDILDKIKEVKTLHLISLLP